MRVVVIGGSGHIGTYLVPSLVKAGHDTVVISRGSRRPYRDDPAWRAVEMVACDRDAAEQDGQFGTMIARLRPDAVVDLTCFTPQQARQLVDALDGQHVVHTGSIWSYGPSAVVPTTEDAPKHPYGEYGVNKLAVERYLTEEQDRVRASVVHPGHISGPGWMPIGPAGNLDPTVIESLRADGSCLLPDRGGETIHHVHAEDVAGLHQACLEQPDAAAGQSFNSVCVLHRRSRCAATPNSWLATSAMNRDWSSCRGTSSLRASTPSTLRRPWITSGEHPCTRWTKPAPSWGSGQSMT